MQRPLDGASRSLFKMYSICLAGPRVGSNGLKKERDARWRYSRHPSLESPPRSALSFLRLQFARSFITFKRLLRRLGVLKR